MTHKKGLAIIYRCLGFGFVGALACQLVSGNLQSSLVVFVILTTFCMIAEQLYDVKRDSQAMKKQEKRDAAFAYRLQRFEWFMIPVNIICKNRTDLITRNYLNELKRIAYDKSISDEDLFFWWDCEKRMYDARYDAWVSTQVKTPTIFRKKVLRDSDEYLRNTIFYNAGNCLPNKETQ